MRTPLKIFLVIIFVCYAAGIKAQQSFEIIVDDKSYQKKLPEDSLQQARWIQRNIISMWEEGYLFAGLDSITEGKVYLHRGNKYKQDESLAFVKGDSTRLLKLNQVKAASWLLDEYQNNGYPFVTIRLDSVQLIREDRYQSYYTVQPGPYIENDSIVLLDKTSVRRSFLASALELQKHKAYEESSFQNIPRNLERIPFLTLKSPPDIAFEDGKSTIYLELKETDKNSFEGVIGLLPGQNADEKLLISGYLNLDLGNLFQRGVEFQTTWNRFASQSQSLDIDYYQPFIFSSPLFVNAGLNLLKQDTTFVTQTLSLGAGTFIRHNFQLKLSYQNWSGNLINENIREEPTRSADFQTNMYGISLGHISSGRHFSFEDGFRTSLSASIGNKQVADSQVGDTTDGTSLIFRYDAMIKYQKTLPGRIGLFHQVRGSSVFNNSIFTNELFRVGGLRSVRGFNENFFFAQHYMLSRLEVRHFFEDRSYFMVFYDQLFYEEDKVWDHPLGLGTGINLNTSNGLFTFALAVGKAKSIPMDLSEIKVHFGYTTRF